MIPLVKPYIPEREVLMPELEKILYSGYIAEGEAVYQFEAQFSKFIGNPFSLAVHAGTDALHLALLLAGVKPGDEVISTAMTAEPTNTAIAMTGARVVWGDVNPRMVCWILFRFVRLLMREQRLLLLCIMPEWCVIWRNSTGLPMILRFQ